MYMEAEWSRTLIWKHCLRAGLYVYIDIMSLLVSVSKLLELKGWHIRFHRSILTRAHKKNLGLPTASIKGIVQGAYPFFFRN